VTRALVCVAVSLGLAWGSATAEEAKRVTITIRVVDSSCKPMVGAWVSLTPVANKEAAQTRGVNAEGVVSFDSLAVAAYRVEARSDSCAMSSIDGLYVDQGYEATITLNRFPGVKTLNSQ
jgi:hypothetical protein